MTLAIDRLAWACRWRSRPLPEKAALGLGLLALALILPPWPGGAMVLASAWILALGPARLPVADWLRLNAAPMGFILTGAAVLAVDLGVDAPHLAADRGQAALAVVLRSGGGVAALLLLAATTPAPDLVRGLRRLGLPEDLAEVMLLTWRFIFLLLDAATAIRTAQEARLGWHGWRRSIRSLGLLVALLLPRAMDQARRLEIGLAARGFHGSMAVLGRAPPARAAALLSIAAWLAALAGAALWLA